MGTSILPGFTGMYKKPNIQGGGGLSRQFADLTGDLEWSGGSGVFEGG